MEECYVVVIAMVQVLQTADDSFGLRLDRITEDFTPKCACCSEIDSDVVTLVMGIIGDKPIPELIIYPTKQKSEVKK